MVLGCFTYIHSRKLTWKLKKGTIETTVLLKGAYMGFHVSLGERIYTHIIGFRRGRKGLVRKPETL